MEKSLYKIALRGCYDTATIFRRLTEDQAALIRSIGEGLQEQMDSHCNPTLHIDFAATTPPDNDDNAYPTKPIIMEDFGKAFSPYLEALRKEMKEDSGYGSYFRRQGAD